MYIYKEQAENLLKEFGITLSQELGHKTNLILDLIDESDWSMIIKSHALIESLVTELLLAKTEEPTLRSLIDRLPLSDEQIGKLKLAKDYELLSAGERSFVKRLSSLRNNLVHKYENINFKLEEYVKTFNSGEKKAWKAAFTWYEESKGEKNSWSAATLEKPKLAVWLAIYMFVSLTTLEISKLQGFSKIEHESKKTTRELLGESV